MGGASGGEGVPLLLHSGTTVDGLVADRAAPGSCVGLGIAVHPGVDVAITADEMRLTFSC